MARLLILIPSNLTQFRKIQHLFGHKSALKNWLHGIASSIAWILNYFSHFLERIYAFKQRQ